MLKLDNNLIKTYEKLVYSIIKKYSSNSNEEDLFQAGMTGVIKASLNYDKDSNVKFSTFSYKYILGEVLKYLREDRNIKLSRDIIKEYKMINNYKEEEYKTTGKVLSDDCLKKLMGVSQNRINEVSIYNESELSLNQCIDEEENGKLEDIIYRKEKYDINDLISLKEAYRSLNKDERKLIYKRYFENFTQSEIAKQSNTTQVKVYRMERKILDKMKDKMV